MNAVNETVILGLNLIEAASVLLGTTAPASLAMLPVCIPNISSSPDTPVVTEET